ncbi:MAG: ferrous iron transport protein B, partial [Thermodesulfobacterium geofontis]
MKERKFKNIKVALVGNPNVGKTSILNYLVKGSLKIGNWPGVTVEKKEGHVFFQDYYITFIDLPGIYTLEETVSEDEKIALDFLLKEDYDLILNIIETPRMERDLYLTSQLLDIGKPIILVLNMIDEAKDLGIEIDVERLSELLKTKVIKTNGRTGEGIEEIFPAIVEVYEKNIKP